MTKYKKLLLTSTVHPPICTNLGVGAIADSGASRHYLMKSDENHCTDLKRITNGPCVKMPNNQFIRGTHSMQLRLHPSLSSEAQRAHSFDHLKSGSLLSIGQLCDDDCVAIFTKYDLRVMKDGTMIIKGHRNKSNGLWHVPLGTPKVPALQYPASEECHSAIYSQNTKADLAGFIHACLFSPAPSTLLRAIRNGHLTTFPGLYPELISKHLPKSLATSTGHM